MVIGALGRKITCPWCNGFARWGSFGVEKPGRTTFSIHWIGTLTELKCSACDNYIGVMEPEFLEKIHVYKLENPKPPGTPWEPWSVSASDPSGVWIAAAGNLGHLL